MDLTTVYYVSVSTLEMLKQDHALLFIMIPMVLLFELPLSILINVGIVRWAIRQQKNTPLYFHPRVSIIITCYGEGDAIIQTVETLCEQIYSGPIQIIPVIDGAVQNQDTYKAALKCLPMQQRYNNRTIDIVPKWQRGGRVSTLNAGLYRATGEIVINVDGDTSFDNNMVYQVLKEFEDPNVPAVGGSLRVRNITDSFWTRMQTIEYMLSMQGGKTGLAEWNLINNVSGAFGAFRRDFLMHIGGWDTHTAEDLDLTVRIKQYMSRHPKLRIPFASLAIGHTDAPVTIKELFNQRLRWDGDLLFLYLRKHKHAFSPKLLGWKTFLYTLFYGVVLNVVMPILVLIYTVWMAIWLPIEFFVGVLAVQYLLYLLLSNFHFWVFWFAISERPREDLKMLPWMLLFFPFYTLTVRFFAAFALVHEWVRRGHEESNMAPWWVLKRGKRF
ncbi:glycosyltransferase family 2 protein [Echinimonas agarilytica]|uniref:Glycosyltransferase n=1 Tax=Echinimonas agarilytica TaxID=1215918 RepID=A0AA41WBU7_9GAMM|nr:glycosyltransferase [Echinimonas agarilytica]MCM2681336.1 glycosyltransferase [Echinimonas agarilytica]